MKELGSLISNDAEEPPGGRSTASVARPAAIRRPAPKGHVQTRPVTREAAFRKRYFPDITTSQWTDWRWQLTHRIGSLTEIERFLTLSDAERAAMDRTASRLPFAVTPYYLSLVSPVDPAEPIRRSVIPTDAEMVFSPGEAEDPLGEDGHSPVPGLVHRYPDRVLFLITQVCSTYCRYCTRSRRVGDETHRGAVASRADRREAIAYIRSHPEIRDVLLSGGDPLTLPDQYLETLLREIRSIPHVEIIRIGTKTPAVLPMRITRQLAAMLRKFHPIYVSIHATHPAELTPRMRRACEILADAGIPLGSQTVLLQGINDDVATMKELMHGLLLARVRPYYIYQCDPILGSSHFRTPVATGLEIIRGLRGHTSGYAVPTYVVDAPGGGGKIPLLPNYVVGYDGDDLLLRNYEDRVFRYPDGGGTL